MSKFKQALATFAFVIIIAALRYFLGFEMMVMVVMTAWFATIIDK